MGRYVAGLVAVVAMAAGCASIPAAPGGRLSVVAAENFWGSIAAQLGGDRVRVRSVITTPDTDPHDYEPTAGDARNVAGADYVIANGVGYDPWVSKLVSASPRRGRIVLDVGRLVGVGAGGNPHRWYSPADVQAVIDRITADYSRLAPADAAYFAQQRAAFVAVSLGRYHALITEIRAKYAGTPVGASESIVVPLAAALGLDLRTPEGFLDAISEGSEPTAGDKATIDAQIRRHLIRVYVLNSQNATPDIRAQVREARAAGIPVTSITETMAPAATTFEAWQTGQLEALSAALAKGTGR